MAKRKKRLQNIREQQYRDSVKEMANWLNARGQRDYNAGYRRWVLTWGKPPDIVDVYAQIVYDSLYQEDKDKPNVATLNDRYRQIKSEIVIPYLKNAYNDQREIERICELRRNAIYGAICSFVTVIGLDGERCHLLDFTRTGYYSKEEEFAFYADVLAGEETFHDCEHLNEIFRKPLFQKFAVQGFCEACKYITEQPEGSLHHLLDFYLLHLRVLECKDSCGKILGFMQKLCQKGEPQREFLLRYYDDRMGIFNIMFEDYPEFDFIEHGRYERYEVIGDFAARLKLTMQDYAHLENFFPPQPTRREGEEKGKGGHSELIDKRVYEALIIGALDRLSTIIAHHVTDMHFINIWPNKVKGRKTAHIVSKYIALVYEFRGEHWILVDSIEQGNAVYLWHGEKLSEGLEIFIKSKTYAKGCEGVYHRNHSVFRLDTLDIYRRVLEDAGGIDVLN